MGALSRPFSAKNIFGDPIFLASISVGWLAWIASLIGCILANVNKEENYRFPNYAWWALAYMFFFMAALSLVVGKGASREYQIAIIGYSSAGLVFNTSSVNAMIYTLLAPQGVASAGFIVLSMVTFIWVFYYGVSDRRDGSSFSDPSDSYGQHDALRGQPVAPYDDKHYPNQGGYNQYPGQPIGQPDNGYDAGGWHDQAQFAPPGALTYEEGRMVGVRFVVRALGSRGPNDEGFQEAQLAFEANDYILLLSDPVEAGWMDTFAEGQVKKVPKNYVKIVPGCDFRANPVQVPSRMVNNGPMKHLPHQWEEFRRNGSGDMIPFDRENGFFDS